MQTHVLLLLVIVAITIAVASLIVTLVSIDRGGGSPSVRVATMVFPVDGVDALSIDGVELQYNDRVLVLDGDRPGIYRINRNQRLEPQTTPKNGSVVTIREGTQFGGTFAVAVTCADTQLRFVPQSATSKGSMRHRLADAEKVPKVLHHIYGLWDTQPMSAEMAANREQWRALLGPEWTLRLWNRADCERLMESPELTFMRPTWNAANTRKCQQADLARYMILYETGGWYLDLDAVPGLAADAQPLPTNKSTLLTETILTPEQCNKVAADQPIRHGVPETPIRIANYGMGFAKKHKFIRDVLMLASKRTLARASVKTKATDYDVIYTTGPDVMSTVFAHMDGTPLLIGLEKSHELVCHRAAGGWRAGADRT
jgi:hypothetical protein